MDAARLAVADACLDTVTMVWVLHLVPNPEPMIAEAARVLRPGGHLVTTVDKASAHGEVRDNPSDARDVVTRLAPDTGSSRQARLRSWGSASAANPCTPSCPLRAPERQRNRPCRKTEMQQEATRGSARRTSLPLTPAADPADSGTCSVVRPELQNDLHWLVTRTCECPETAPRAPSRGSRPVPSTLKCPGPSHQTETLRR